jgi:hypothetical protein
MDTPLSRVILIAGVAQFAVLMASALVPFRLNWREQLQCLSQLHRQMYWVYAGYVVLSIVAFAAMSVFHSRELASGSGLARGFCAYVAVFWGIRLGLQFVLDVKEHLSVWWLEIGYLALTIMFAGLTVVYAWAAMRAVQP